MPKAFNLLFWCSIFLKNWGGRSNHLKKWTHKSLSLFSFCAVPPHLGASIIPLLVEVFR